MTTEKKQTVAIKPVKMITDTFRIEGTAPLVQHRFGNKAEIMATQAAGSVAKKGIKREPKDFEALYQKAMHRSSDGWLGLPASAFRSAMISACRLVGFKMTLAKLSVFVEADGYSTEGDPLVKFNHNTCEPEMRTDPVRNDSGVIDIRARPMWKRWGADVRIRYDADQFSSEDVLNLLGRVGAQVGICEGRPDSKDSAGMGWGTFRVTHVNPGTDKEREVA